MVNDLFMRNKGILLQYLADELMTLFMAEIEIKGF